MVQVILAMMLSSQGGRNARNRRHNGFATTVKLLVLLVMASQATPMWLNLARWGSSFVSPLVILDVVFWSRSKEINWMWIRLSVRSMRSCSLYGGPNDTATCVGVHIMVCSLCWCPLVLLVWISAILLFCWYPHDHALCVDIQTIYSHLVSK